DGRIVMLHDDRDALRVAVYSRDGAKERAIDLPSAPYALFGDEVTPGKVVVATSKPPESRRQFETSVVHLVDLTKGQTRKVAEKLIPGSSRGANLYAAEGMALVYFDPLTGERRTLID
ncbi:MAG TPA: hypothetical protein VIL97_00830, partial [Thermoanaerobaculia bacterium]